MAFLNNKQYKLIRDAQKNGDERAIAICQAYMKGCEQTDLDKMVSDYFNPQELTQQTKAAIEQSNAKDGQSNAETSMDAVDAPDAMVGNVQAEAPSIADISGELDKELDGVFDIPEIKESSFDDFIKKKKSNALRAKKDSGYFRAFDEDGRLDYLQKKKDEFSKKLDVNRKDIDRSFRDMDSAIGGYSMMVSEIPDDPNELDLPTADKAYDDIMGLKDKTHSFGRGWDDEDNKEMRDELQSLVAKYGKKNVLAALNSLKGDNQAYHDFRRGQIDQATGDYGKALDKLLK